MIQGSKIVMNAFATPQGRIIRDFLEKCALEKISKLLVAEDHEMYRTQGAAQELNEIVDLANNAEKGLHS